MKALESWVVEAAEGRDSNPDAAARAKFIQDVINCLSKLPVDLDVLKQSGIGRTFGKLPKSLSAAVLGDHVSEVAAACKALVDQWKGLLNNAPGKAGAAAKQQAGGSSGAGASDSNEANKRSGTSRMHTHKLAAAVRFSANDLLWTNLRELCRCVEEVPLSVCVSLCVYGITGGNRLRMPNRPQRAASVSSSHPSQLTFLQMTHTARHSSHQRYPPTFHRQQPASRTASRRQPQPVIR